MAKSTSGQSDLLTDSRILRIDKKMYLLRGPKFKREGSVEVEAFPKGTKGYSLINILLIDLSMFIHFIN